LELIVTLGDRQQAVQVRTTADGYQVHLGEVTYRVNTISVGSGLQSLLVHQEGETEARSHHREVFVQARQEGRYWVRAGGPNPGTTVEVTDPLTHLAKTSRGGSGRGGRSQVTAYMPGRVVAVLVEEGSEVEEGQGVVVLEAMKMENEIPAESAGTVVRILVESGQAVDAGDPLFEIK